MKKLFCWGDDCRILDQDGRDVYLADGKAFVVLRKRLAFLDMAGNELAEIRQRLLSWGPSYDYVTVRMEDLGVPKERPVQLP